jgi:hypothetical protein
MKAARNEYKKDQDQQRNQGTAEVRRGEALHTRSAETNHKTHKRKKLCRTR